MVWIVSWHIIFFKYHKHTSILNLFPEVALVTKYIYEMAWDYCSVTEIEVVERPFN